MEVHEGLDEEMMPPPASVRATRSSRATSSASVDSNLSGRFARAKRIINRPPANVSRGNSAVSEEEEIDEESDCPIRQSFRLMITSLLRTIFETEENIEVIVKCNNVYTKQFVTLWKRIRKAFPKPANANNLDSRSNTDPLVDIALDEIRLRLNYLIEDVDRSSDRLRVFIVLIISSLFLHFKLEERLLLNFMVKYCTTNAEVDCANARLHCLKMLGKLFNYWYVSPMFKNPAIKKTNSRYVFDMDDNTRDKIYEVLLRRRCDTVVPVRIAAVQAIGEFQEMAIPNDFPLAIEQGPKELIRGSLLDPSVVVQLTAIKIMNLQKNLDDNFVQSLVEVAGGPHHEHTKMEAIRRLGTISFLDIRREVVKDIITSTLRNNRNFIREYTRKKLLAPWLLSCAQRIAEENGKPIPEKNSDQPYPGLGAAIVCLLELLTVNDGDFIIDDEMMHSIYDAVRNILYPSGKRASLVELIQYVTHDTPSKLATRYHLDPIRKNDDIQSMALASLIWRTLIEYCLNHTDPTKGMENLANPEATKEDCMQKLTPDLGKVIDIFKMVWKKNDIHKYTETPPLFLTEVEAICYNRCLTELLKVCSLVETTNDDEKETRKLWIDIMMELLKNKNLDKILIDEIAKRVVCLHERGDDGTEPNSFIKAALENIDAYKTFETEKINYKVYEAAISKSKNPDAFVINPANLVIFTHATNIIQSFLRTGIFLAADSAEFNDLAACEMLTSEIFDLNRSTKHCRATLYRALGGLMMSNPKIVYENFNRLYKVITAQDTDEETVVAAIGIQFDIIQHYGLGICETWCKETCYKWLQLITNAIDGKEEESGARFYSEGRFAICEAACKMLLMNPIPERASAYTEEQKKLQPYLHKYLILLMKQYFELGNKPEVMPYGKFHSMFCQFIWIYVNHSDFNRRMAVMAIFPSMEKTVVKICKPSHRNKHRNKHPNKIIPDLETVLKAISLWLNRDLVPYKVEKGNLIVASSENSCYTIYAYYMDFLAQLITHEATTNSPNREAVVEVILRYASNIDLSELDTAELKKLDDGTLEVEQKAMALARSSQIFTATSMQLLNKLRKNLDSVQNLKKSMKEEEQDEDYVHVTKIIQRGGERGRGRGRGRGKGTSREPQEAAQVMPPPPSPAKERIQPQRKKAGPSRYQEAEYDL